MIEVINERLNAVGNQDSHAKMGVTGQCVQLCVCMLGRLMVAVV